MVTKFNFCLIPLLINFFICFYGCRDASEILLSNPLTTKDCWQELKVKNKFSVINYKPSLQCATFVADFNEYDILLFIDSTHYDLWEKQVSEMQRVKFQEKDKWNRRIHGLCEYFGKHCCRLYL